MTAKVAATETHLIHLDTLAFMIGNYVGTSYHNPKKYPRKQQFFKPPNKPQGSVDDESMKTTLTTYAEIHNEIEVSRSGGNT